MVAPTPNSAPSASGDDRNIVTIDDSYLNPSFEDRVQMFWEKNSSLITTVGVVVVLGLAGRWGFEQYAAYRERQVKDAYARAASTAELESFAQANPAAALSGVARLRVADESYKSGDYRAASTAYAAAALLLKDTPLLDRARLGAALSSLQAQDSTAMTALEAVANDVALSKATRAEAAYRLAVLARDNGRNEDAARWAATVSTVDTSGLWSQRANQLKEQLPLTASIPVATTPADAGAAVSFPASGK
jgi:hypothetical protein